MNTARRKSSRMDRRKATRKIRRDPAFIGGKRENAVIEETSASGLRVRSGQKLRNKEAVVLYDSDGRALYHAKVIWARPEGMIDKRSGRPGQAFLAGCQVVIPARKRIREKYVPRVGDGKALGLMLKIIAVAAGLGLLGLIFYAISSILSLW